jgi:hypothetical protein
MRLWMSAVGVHFGHSCMLPTRAIPENASASSPTVMP